MNDPITSFRGGRGGRWSTFAGASVEPAQPRTKVVLHPPSPDALPAIQGRIDRMVTNMAAAREGRGFRLDFVIGSEEPPAPAEILAVADDLDGADADSAFVAEVMREAVADTAPAGAVGWLARISRRWFR